MTWTETMAERRIRLSGMRPADPELERLRAGASNDLPRLNEQCPELALALHRRPYQLSGAAFILRARRCLLGDQPGLGKTYQAIASIVESGAQRVIVIAPKTSLRSVWQRKINELAGETAITYLAEGPRAQRQNTIAAFNADTASPHRLPRAAGLRS